MKKFLKNTFLLLFVIICSVVMFNLNVFAGNTLASNPKDACNSSGGIQGCFKYNSQNKTLTIDYSVEIKDDAWRIGEAYIYCDKAPDGQDKMILYKDYTKTVVGAARKVTLSKKIDDLKPGYYKCTAKFNTYKYNSKETKWKVDDKNNAEDTLEFTVVEVTSSGKGNTCGKTDYNQWTQSNCGGVHTEGGKTYSYEWNFSDSCCEKIYLNVGTTSQVTNKTTDKVTNKVTQAPVTKYTATLNGNGSVRFTCPTGFDMESKDGNGICNNRQMTKGSSFQLPKVDEADFKGWSLNDKECKGTIVAAGTSIKVNSHVIYYACYNTATNPSSSSINFNITFNGNGGPGYACPTNVKWVKEGICSQDVSKGTKVVLPKVDLLKDNKYKLIGWSTEKSCPSNSIKKAGETVVVSSHVNYYACYIETINEDRFPNKNAAADGKSITCGTSTYITYCVNENNVEYCFTKDNIKVYRDKLRKAYESTDCGEKSPTKDFGDRYVGYASDDFKCGDKLYITTCTESTCNFTKVNDVEKTGTVIRNNLKDFTETGRKNALAACTIAESDKKCPAMNVEKDNTTSGIYNLCYKKGTGMSEIKEMLEKYYKCADGYSFDKTFISVEGKEDCNSYICKTAFNVRCNKAGGLKPSLTIKSGHVDSSNYGVVSVEARAYQGEIDGYYVSETLLAPTLKNKWEPVSGNSFTIKGRPGTLYVWVRDSYGNISNVVRATIYDNNNSDTTIKKLALYDANGNIQTPSNSVGYNSSVIKSNKYVMMSNDLRKDSNIMADAFNPYEMEYALEVDTPTISVYATLTSNDAKYVPGYEPRTVNLNYGMNTILIKIQDNVGRVRTYTILVTRKDDRTSDNTLNDISVSVGEIEFNSNITDYKIEIPKNTKSVDVTSKITSSVASYVSGYEPGVVSITGDTTVKLIKVKRQTGTTRTYVLTFVKEGTDVITDKTLQLKDFGIPNVYIPFESEVSNYSFSVEYETDVIDLSVILNDANSEYVTTVRNGNGNEYIVGTNKGINLEPGENFLEIKVTNADGKVSYYRFTIIRKEFGLGISNDNTLKELRVLGYDIQFNPNKKEYTVKIKQEKSLVITAVPNNNRAEVFIRGNDELTGFSTVRVKVVAENGEFDTYSIDIKKDPFNKVIEIASIVACVVIIIGTSTIIVISKRKKSKKDYFNE